MPVCILVEVFPCGSIREAIPSGDIAIQAAQFTLMILTAFLSISRVVFTPDVSFLPGDQRLITVGISARQEASTMVTITGIHIIM